MIRGKRAHSKSIRGSKCPNESGAHAHMTAQPLLNVSDLSLEFPTRPAS